MMNIKLFAGAMFLLPITGWAQVTQSSPTQSPSRVNTFHEQHFGGSFNPRMLKLSAAINLYRHLRDTVSSEPVKRLHAGDFVLVEASHGNWLAVCRGKSSTRFSSDTATYYVPKVALHWSRAYILL
jgi:hypothetical protein